jgi:Serine hydrolase (FSH1)
MGLFLCPETVDWLCVEKPHQKTTHRYAHTPTPTPTRMSSSARRLRVLCLHGYTQNGCTFRSRLGALRTALSPVINEWICPDAPFPVIDGDTHPTALPAVTSVAPYSQENADVALSWLVVKKDPETHQVHYHGVLLPLCVLLHSCFSSLSSLLSLSFLSLSLSNSLLSLS